MLTSSLVLYALICHVVGDAVAPDPAQREMLPVLEKALFVVSLFLIVSSTLLRRRMFVAKPEREDTGSGESGAESLIRLVSTRYLSGVVISLVLSESAGVFGLVLFLLGGGFGVLYLFLGMSAVALSWNKPKIDEAERLYAEMERRR